MTKVEGLAKGVKCYQIKVYLAKGSRESIAENISESFAQSPKAWNCTKCFSGHPDASFMELLTLPWPQTPIFNNIILALCLTL